MDIPNIGHCRDEGCYAHGETVRRLHRLAREVARLRAVQTENVSPDTILAGIGRLLNLWERTEFPDQRTRDMMRLDLMGVYTALVEMLGEQCSHCHDDPPEGHTCPRCGRVAVTGVSP